MSTPVDKNSLSTNPNGDGGGCGILSRYPLLSVVSFATIGTAIGLGKHSIQDSCMHTLGLVIWEHEEPMGKLANVGSANLHAP